MLTGLDPGYGYISYIMLAGGRILQPSPANPSQQMLSHTTTINSSIGCPFTVDYSIWKDLATDS